MPPLETAYRTATLRRTTVAILTWLCLLCPTATPAAPRAPVVGSAETVTAGPPVPHPATAPVRVALFTGSAFNSFIPHRFQYRPPAERRPWARVVFVADFAVSAGRQFDRTCQVSLGGVNVYCGTTPEPSRGQGQRWHVERDVTDDVALLRAPRPGVADLGSLVNATYTGRITGSAALLFYPAGRADPAPDAPDVVLPLPRAGGSASLSGASGALTETLTLPTNVTRACLDLIAQGQGGDEFWYLGVPARLTGPLKAGGGTAFREAEVGIDGHPAGVAPVFPWVFTGGIDPYLWRPIPGVQTLNLMPYRVDLTPFAALLSDGRPHTLTIQVYNAGDSFRVIGTLLLWRDPVLKAVTGRLTADTLTARPAPAVAADVVADGAGARGPVSITSDRRFVVGGYVNTSRGRVTTVIRQRVRFSSVQAFNVTPRHEAQDVRQETAVTSDTRTTRGASTTDIRTRLGYSLGATLRFPSEGATPGAQAAGIAQGYRLRRTVRHDGVMTFASSVHDDVRSSDSESYDAASKRATHTGRTGAAAYGYSDSTGASYRRSLTAADGILTSARTQTSGKMK